MTAGDIKDPASAARLRELEARFRATLEKRVAVILAHARAVRVGIWPGPTSEDFRSEVHGLAGSAGMFGQTRIGDAASAIERLLIGLGKRKTITAVDIAQLREAARMLEQAHAERVA